MYKKCEMCGSKFEATSKNQKYCSTQCRKLAVRRSHIVYNNKQREKALKEYQAPMVETQTASVQPVAKKIVYRTTQTTTEQATIVASHIDTIDKALNSLKELDKARKNVQDILDVLKIEQAKYNKEDFEFAHIVEGSKGLSDYQKLKVFNDYQETRSKRRNVKDIIKVLIGCIRYTPVCSENILRNAMQDKIKVDEFFKDFYKQRGV